MRKLVFLTAIITFFLTGCGTMTTETMSCTYNTANDYIDSRITYNVDHEKNDVKKVRVTYKYMQIDTNVTEDIDGVGTGTDGTTNDELEDTEDGIVDGIVGNAIDDLINGVANTILDLSDIKAKHANIQNTYGNITGFSTQNTTDSNDKNYTVTYVIDFDSINDDDLVTLNLSRDFDSLRTKYIQQGFTCD